ncbi:hypothetical protein SARC_14285, partial [Sphaeroforma arctica JP610]
VEYSDVDTDRITKWVCAFTLAIAIASTLVYPITIASNEILAVLRKFPKDYRWYWDWLDRDLILGYWSGVSHLSNLVLFMLIPFTVFYKEVEPSPSSMSRLRNANSHSLCPGVNRACMSLACLWLLVGGWMYVSLSWMGNLPKSTYNMFAYLPYLQSTINFVGALLFFRCVRLVGCVEVCSWWL